MAVGHVYVYGEGGGNELPYAFKDLQRGADALQLLGIDKHGKNLLLSGREPEVLVREPEIPYMTTRCEQFSADASYDLVCLTRSPRYSPASADALFDVLRSMLIDELAYDAT